MVGKLFRKMLPSQIISNVAMTLCVQIDTILIGRFLGVQGMASYGLVMPLMILFTALTGVVSVGISTVCAGLVGKGDSEGVNRQFSSSILLSAGMGVLFAVLTFAFSGPISVFLGAESGTTLYTDSVTYLRGYAIGIPAYFLMTSLTSYLHIAGKRRLVTTSIIVMTVVDITFDILSGTVLDLGMFGMGAASSLSEIVALVVILFYFFSKKCMFRFSLRNVELKPIISTLIAGQPIAVNQICFTIGMLTINRLLLEYGGSDGVAVFSVVGSIANPAFATGSGVGGTTQVLSGIFYAEGDRKSVLASLRYGIMWEIVLSTALSVLVFIFAEPIVRVYMTAGEDVIKLTAHAMRLNIWHCIPMLLTIVFKNYYPCIGKLRLAIIAGACGNLVGKIPAYILMAKGFGLDGIWLGDIVSEILALVAIVIITWCVNRSFGLSLSKFSLIENHFPVSDDCITSFDVKDETSLVAASTGAADFCRAAGGDKRFSNYVGLCIEEMCADIMARSFVEGKDNFISVKLVNKGDEWVIRFRDNCEQFDTAGYMKLHHSDDAISHLGIRIVFGLVTEAKYITSLGLNCLTLKLKKEKS